jgi:hypothetical protein
VHQVAVDVVRLRSDDPAGEQGLPGAATSRNRIASRISATPGGADVRDGAAGSVAVRCGL